MALPAKTGRTPVSPTLYPLAPMVWHMLRPMSEFYPSYLQCRNAVKRGNAERQAELTLKNLL
jgi:hypothetical protein